MPNNFDYSSQDNRRRSGSSSCNCGWDRRDDRRDDHRDRRDDRHDNRKDSRRNNNWPWR